MFKSYSRFTQLFIIALLTLFPFKLKAEKVPTEYARPYLCLSLYDGDFVLLSLNEDFKIDNIGKEIKVNLGGNPAYIPVEEIATMGFISILSPVSEVEDIELDNLCEWKIFDSKGVLIREGFSEKPDLSSLKRGEVYIILLNSQSFKYIPYQ